MVLESAGVPEPDRAVDRAADCRYTRQAYELTVPLAPGTVTRATLDELAREFHGLHLRTYGHESPSEPVQMVNVRVTATGRMPRVEFHARPEVEADAARTATAGGGEAAEREVWFGKPVRCAVLARHDLPRAPSAAGAEAGAAPRATGGDGAAGARPGPFIVEEMDCTVVVPPGWNAALDERGFILMNRNGGNRAG